MKAKITETVERCVKESRCYIDDVGDGPELISHLIEELHKLWTKELQDEKAKTRENL